MCLCSFVFFFSSRRRHTRLQGDWSSDVCSSDLLLAGSPQAIQQDPARTGWEAIQRGDGEKAASAFRQVLAANPRDARALTGAGMAAHLLGRDDDAVSSLKRAVQV